MLNKGLRGLSVPLCLASLVGCAGNVGFDAVSAEQRVAERTQEHLALLMGGRWEQALEYAAPGYRQKTEVQQYAMRYRGAGSWTGTTVDQVTCNSDDAGGADRCEVLYQISYKWAQPLASIPDVVARRQFQRVWILVDGDWFLAQG